MSGPLIIRRATVADAQPLADLHNDIVRDEYDGAYSPEAIAAWADNDAPKWRGLIETKTSHFFLAVIDEQIVGAAGLNLLTERLGVYVLPAWHEQGIGSRLLKLGVDFARDHGVSKLSLSSPAAAVPFYARMGYKLCSERVHTFANGATINVFDMEYKL